MSLLDVQGLNSYYADSHVLFDVGLRIEPNEVVALLGRNGAGKSTTLKSIAGAVKPRAGQITFDGKPIAGLEPFKIANAGIQLVPEERRIFGSITVEENLVLAGVSHPDPAPLDDIYAYFPRLKERRKSGGRQLSGGEQQMLAIARALMRKARLILLDEPFEGLAPVIVHQLIDICGRLAAEGRTVLIVEQNVFAVLNLAHRVYVLNNGHMVFDGSPQALRSDKELMQTHLGV
ncbi:MAG: ABC transporter ATP-binding protein [Acetobacteraceae bacterium]|nr:ABC transporter ATP-binding protein [Acetobacteraceae bacterium]